MIQSMLDNNLLFFIFKVNLKFILGMFNLKNFLLMFLWEKNKCSGNVWFSLCNVDENFFDLLGS